MLTVLRMWKYEVCGRMERMVLHFEVPKRFMNTIGLANMNTMKSWHYLYYSINKLATINFEKYFVKIRHIDNLFSNKNDDFWSCLLLKDNAKDRKEILESKKAISRLHSKSPNEHYNSSCRTAGVISTLCPMDRYSRTCLLGNIL
jgi:hypothetical protein